MSDSDEVHYSSRSRFLFGEPTEFFRPIDALRGADTPLLAPLEAFRQNLQSAIMVGSIPFQLAHTAVLDIRFNQLLSAERIRALKSTSTGDEADHEGERTAREIAGRRMDDELGDTEIVQRHAKATLSRLDHHLDSEDFRASSEEMLRQVLVMSWTAFEIASNDLVRILLNSRPKLARKLFDEKPLRDLISSRTLLDKLESADFDLSSSMGDLVSHLMPQDNLEKIRTTWRLAAESPELERRLKDSRLWNLFQKRNLIVHRRGLIDSRYVERTGDNAIVGEKITVTAEQVEESMEVARDAGVAIYVAAYQGLSV